MLTVHPRVCGERSRKMSSVNPFFGSSPRVRGTLDKILPLVFVKRFIPACAGNASSDMPGQSIFPVHPRVCGERPTMGNRGIEHPGSSPRVRGTLLIKTTCGIYERFIPACAGNAAYMGAWAIILTVHPRVCGERLPITSAAQKSTGSSPRVRGTHLI